MNLLKFKGWLVNRQEGGTLIIRCPCSYTRVYRPVNEQHKEYYFPLHRRCDHEVVPKEILIAFKMIK